MVDYSLVINKVILCVMEGYVRQWKRQRAVWKDYR